MNKLLIILLLPVIFFGLSAGITKAEKVECNKWQSQSEEFANFTVTDWQVEQCSRYDIELN